MSRANDVPQDEGRYWIAINGASCALCPAPSKIPPTVSPRPEGLIGFSTYEEARAAMQLCLTALIPEVAKAVERWRRGEDGAVCIVCANPEPPTRGSTAWSFPGSTPS